MATAQPAIFRDMGKNQWYVHLSRVDGASVAHIKKVLKETRAWCDDKAINLVVGVGPGIVGDLGLEMPNDFQRYETVVAGDGSGKQAKGTQEELLLWMTKDDKGDIWEAQYKARTALKGHMAVARETLTFIYGASLDMTGFIDGTGNPETMDLQRQVAIVPDGQPGAGGSFIIAMRWVHDLEGWNQMSVEDQEKVFGRAKPDSKRLDKQEAYSHLSHVELRDGKTADASKAKRNEIARRSTPYALHDGTVGLYFMAFCKDQAPLRERLNAMYNVDGKGTRDRLVDFSNPASGSFYFAPSVEQLNKALA